MMIIQILQRNGMVQQVAIIMTMFCCRQETDLFQRMNDSDVAFSNHGGEAKGISLYEEENGFSAANAVVACISQKSNYSDFNS